MKLHWLALTVVLLLALTAQFGVPLFVGWHLDSWLAGAVAFVSVQIIWHVATGGKE